jgi:hypothetical protein
MTHTDRTTTRRLGALAGLVLSAVALTACGPNPQPSPTTGPTPSGALATPPLCMVQEVWERHEGAFTGHWEASGAAAAASDSVEGSSEARLAATEVRAMADQAAGTNPGVAGHLRASANRLDAAAAAFGTGDLSTAETRLADAEAEHEAALTSTTVMDWC